MKSLLEMVVNRNFPQAYCRVSKIFQEMGLPDIMVEQMVSMVSYCMIHGTSDTLTVYAIRYLMEQVQMEIVMGAIFVQLTFDKFGTWTTKTW